MVDCGDGVTSVPGDATGDASYYDADGRLIAVMAAGLVTYTIPMSNNSIPCNYPYPCMICDSIAVAPEHKRPAKVEPKEPFYAALYPRRRER